MIRYDGLGCRTIFDTARIAAHMAADSKEAVGFEFNGQELVVQPGQDFMEIVYLWIEGGGLGLNKKRQDWKQQWHDKYKNGWIGVDLDGTLAKYHGWRDGEIGDPVPLMQCRVHAWLLAKIDVRIVTARVGLPVVPWPGYDAKIMAASIAEERAKIEGWCLRHFGQKLIVTASKDFKMVELWDDRAISVLTNTGRRLDDPEIF